MAKIDWSKGGLPEPSRPENVCPAPNQPLPQGDYAQDGELKKDAPKPAKSVKQIPPLKAHYEVGRVAALLDMSVRWAKERVKAGDLEGFRLGNRIVVSAESLEVFMRNRRM